MMFIWSYTSIKIELFGMSDMPSKILIVEDNEMNRDMLSRRLEKRGYQVITAENGELGVQLAIAQTPDLILMDIGLPGMDGNAATRILKADPGTSHIPIIGLSANAMEADRQESLNAGCDDYDTKPIEIDRLLQKILRFLPA
jgi:two-component system, cell cycle response regulator DivK